MKDLQFVKTYEIKTNNEPKEKPRNKTLKKPKKEIKEKENNIKFFSQINI